VTKPQETERMEAPMKRSHFIAADVHCQFSEIAVVDRQGKVIHRDRCHTTIPALLEVVAAVPRPRALVIEEGPMAGWLWRGLHHAVDRMVVSEPRRNRLICADGDKDDDLDAEKLAQLLRADFVKEVHQVQSLERAVFKEQVALYHFRVRQRVRESLRLTSWFRQHGVVIREKAYAARDDRPALLARLPAQAVLQEAVRLWFQSYDALVQQEELWRKRVVQLAQAEEVVRRFQALPGVGWIRAATLYAYLDTPWRFRNKSALWKYLGIGLEREHSGNGPEHVGVPLRTHRLLKSTILGAARSAVAQGKNPFADLHGRWMQQGLSARLARRNVARVQAATLWGLWKNGSAYRPEWVGVAAAAQRGDSGVSTRTMAD
jgi:transposase